MGSEMCIRDSAYPDLVEKQSFITRVIRTEEESFARTIDGGMRILAELMDGLKAKGETVLSGADAFRLYDTYGFPLDLTEDVLSESGMTADTEGFNALMQEQRERARAARGDISGWSGLDLGLDAVPTVFTGYDKLEDAAKVEALVVEGELSGELREGVEGTVVLDRTPFYAEMGGQVADHGVIEAEGVTFEVRDVQKTKGGKYLHSGVLRSGELRLDMAVTAKVDAERRRAIMRAHSATHLLHAALRQVLGDHVHQAGSLVEPDRLRFDFTHFSAMTGEEMLEVGRIVNSEILRGDAISIAEMGIDEARAQGAQALFGEKYGETVRVVNMGDFSIELCGGTHVEKTGVIATFKIVSEAGVAAGVRRIEALTSRGAFAYYHNLENTLKQASAAAKAEPANLVEKIEGMLAEIKQLQSENQKLKDKMAKAAVGDVLSDVVSVGDYKVLPVSVSGVDMNALRNLGDEMKTKIASGVVILASDMGDKVNLIVMATDDAVKAGAHAGNIIKKIAPMVGGGGGGRPNMAQAGGKNPAGIKDALEAGVKEAEAQLS